MGIPIIVFYPTRCASHKSNKERFSSLEKMIRVYTVDEIERVNWNPRAINIDNLKSNIIADFESRVGTILNGAILTRIITP